MALPEVEPGVRCPTGEARVTPGFDLPARHVIHTVGPVWRGGGHGEARLLEACYRHSLEQARALGAERVVFPAISCGIYGYPAGPAARIAVDSVRREQAAHGGHPQDVVLCCYSDTLLRVFQSALDASPAPGA
jgi:O-acetyl-ADP-ribose deacetylase (regulator of RNase III)